MTLKQAIKILKRHNRWRRGADIQMQKPKKIGEAIEFAVQFMESWQKIEKYKE